MRDGYGLCPVCNGTCQVGLNDKEKSYSWNKDKKSLVLTKKKQSTS